MRLAKINDVIKIRINENMSKVTKIFFQNNFLILFWKQISMYFNISRKYEKWSWWPTSFIIFEIKEI